MSVVGGTKLIAISRPLRKCCLTRGNFMVFCKKVNGNSADSLVIHNSDLNVAEKFYRFLSVGLYRYF